MNELQSRLERLEKRQAKTTRAIERVKAEIKEAEAAAARRKVITIEVGGLHWARVNLGTDVDHPNGLHYTFDEAQAACPKGWAIPTKEQWKQLNSRTTSVWTSRDGINGRLFTDKENGNELFLPAAGYRFYNDGSLYNETASGYYWSSSVFNADSGWNLLFYSGGVGPESAGNRGHGFSVRCVQEQ